MPNRIVREGILTSPKVARLGWAEEVFYRRLLSVVDDFGRYYADPGMLRAACYPRQLNKVSDSDVGKWLGACSDAALVRVYPAEDGERYLEVVKFDQQVRAKKSRFPACDMNLLSTCLSDAKQTPANAHLDVFVSVVDKSLRDSSPASQATCPHEAICSMWNEQMPELPAIRQWTDARRKLLQSRWREAPERQTLAWWQEFFDFVRRSDFLMGRLPGRDGHSWECTLPWLLKAENFAKVVEGNYDNRDVA